MIEIIENTLRSNGMRCIKIIHSRDVKVRPSLVVPKYIQEHCPWMVNGSQVEDLGIMQATFEYPVMEPVRLGKPWKQFFFVHKVYGVGIRDCVRLGVEAWAFGAKQEADLAFVRKLPKGVEDGAMINLGAIYRAPTSGEACKEIHLFEAEWMMTDCVAVTVS